MNKKEGSPEVLNKVLLCDFFISVTDVSYKIVVVLLKVFVVLLHIVI